MVANILVFLLLCGTLLSTQDSAAQTSVEKARAQKGLQSFLTIVGETTLSKATQEAVSKHPDAAKDFLLACHAEMTPPLFSQTISLLAEEPLLLHTFLMRAVAAIDQAHFQELIHALVADPETIRTLTVTPLSTLSDEDIVKTMRVAVKHPKALKLFSLELDDRVLVDFSEKSFSDREAFVAIIDWLKKDRKRLRALAPGVDLYEISGKIVRALDQDYFRELLVPADGTDLALVGLSLTDGIIDLPGQEEISLSGVNRQIRRMIDPKFVVAFLWNMYFGDQTSQRALEFRKELLAADAADGKKDDRIRLHDLKAVAPEKFTALRQAMMRVLEVARFRDQMSEPEILLDPLLDFLDRHPAEDVYSTIAPLFLRSIRIRPKLTKIVMRELPDEVIGALLANIVDELGKSPSGRIVLKRLLLSLWETIPGPELKRAVELVQQKDPDALYHLVIPVIQAMNPQGLAKTTKEFMKYEAVFYQFNGTALRGLPVEKLSSIVDALTQSPKPFFNLALTWTKRISPATQDAYVLRLAKNEAFVNSLAHLIGAVEPTTRADLGRQFEKNAGASALVMKHLPPPITAAALRAFKESK